ncbi:MAG: glycosyltransferase family 4 protein, partial [Aestuariibacter sp.]|nr:glycosyltransferase family 4 protein [Aestuariibacter sp.]
RNEHPEIPLQFHVFGEGQLEEELKNLSKLLKLTSHVSFHGHRMDIRNCIYGLDAIVMCSDHEGLPMTALESIVIGTPLIAHNVGGLAEVLKSSPSTLVSSHTPVMYSKKVLEVITDSTGMTDLPECYHIERTASKVYESYTSIVLG